MGNTNCCFYKKKDYVLFTDDVYDPLEENIVYDTMIGQEEDKVAIPSHNNLSHNNLSNSRNAGTCTHKRAIFTIDYSHDNSDERNSL